MLFVFVLVFFTGLCISGGPPPIPTIDCTEDCVRSEQKLVAYDGSHSDRFGSCVAGNSDRIVVGAPDDDLDGSNYDTGSLYVYKLDGEGFVFEQKITSLIMFAHDKFGCSIAIEANVIVTGAVQAGPGDQGQAYVIEFNGTRWNQVAILVAPDASSGDNSGAGVAISLPRIIVSSHKDDDHGSDSGSANIYVRNSLGQWIHEIKLTSPDASAGDQFGKNLDIHDNWALVSGHTNDDSGSSSGSAYFLKLIPGVGWVHMQKVTASDAQLGDNFGRSVSISSKIAVITAHLDDDQGSASGSAYIFERQGNTWTQVKKLLADDGQAFDLFGVWGSSSISGNMIAIGASQTDDNGSESGSVYLFEKVDGVWFQHIKQIVATDSAAGDYFGSYLHLFGKYLVVGSYKSNAPEWQTGATYVYEICCRYSKQLPDSCNATICPINSNCGYDSTSYDHVCVCEEGWDGDNCDVRVCPSECIDPGICRSNGRCYVSLDNDTCTEYCHCQTFYIGQNCSTNMLVLLAIIGGVIFVVMVIFIIIIIIAFGSFSAKGNPRTSDIGRNMNEYPNRRQKKTYRRVKTYE